MSSRIIVLDTETTGLNVQDENRVIEIGAIELIDRHFTGRSFHRYLNPRREIEKGAIAIHGIDSEFLKDKPVFAEVMDEFINFIMQAELVIHNADFDVGFLNYEFSLANPNQPKIADYVTAVFDTLGFARKKHPGKKNSLDALCKRYGVDNSSRMLNGHGALRDAKLLADVYLIMTGGQLSLFSDDQPEKSAISTFENDQNKQSRAFGSLAIIYANELESTEHLAYLKMMQKKYSKCLWDKG